MNTQSQIQDYTQSFGLSNIRHIMLNYSQTEVGIKHPENPSGFVARDEFQADMYAGKSRIILTGSGYIFGNSDCIVFNSEETYFNVADPKNFKINNKHVNQSIFNGTNKVLTTNIDLNQYLVLNPTSIVVDFQNNPIGLITNTTSLGTVINAQQLYNQDPNKPQSKDVELYNIYKDF